MGRRWWVMSTSVAATSARVTGHGAVDGLARDGCSAGNAGQKKGAIYRQDREHGLLGRAAGDAL